LPAQMLAQTRPGARGALLFYSCVPVSEFGPGWPEGLPAQIHGMDADPIFAGEGDIDAARELVSQAKDAELFLYPGDQHYFADSSLPSYDPDATVLLTQRVLHFLRTRQPTRFLPPCRPPPHPAPARHPGGVKGPAPNPHWVKGPLPPSIGGEGPFTPNAHSAATNPRRPGRR